MVIIHGLHCHSDHPTIIRLFYESVLMSKVVKFYSRRFQTLCKQYTPFSVGKQILLKTKVVIVFLLGPNKLYPDHGM